MLAASGINQTASPSTPRNGRTQLSVTVSCHFSCGSQPVQLSGHPQTIRGDNCFLWPAQICSVEAMATGSNDGVVTNDTSRHQLRSVIAGHPALDSESRQNSRQDKYCHWSSLRNVIFARSEKLDAVGSLSVPCYCSCSRDRFRIGNLATTKSHDVTEMAKLRPKSGNRSLVSHSSREK